MGIGDASPYPLPVVQHSLVSGGMQDRFMSQSFSLLVTSSTSVTLSLIQIQNRLADTVAATRARTRYPTRDKWKQLTIQSFM